MTWPDLVWSDLEHVALAISNQCDLQVHVQIIPACAGHYKLV